MRFEARELKEFAEPVSVVDLRIGDAYFAVQYVDGDLLVPVVTPYAYVGRDLVPGDEQQHYFQQYANYATGERFDGSDGDWPDVERYGPTEMKHLFAYEAALDNLLRTSIRRKRNATPGHPPPKWSDGSTPPRA